MMGAARFNDWWRGSCGVGLLAWTAAAGSVRAQDPRPVELRVWPVPWVARPELSLSGEVTSCTLVRCNQTASLFASTQAPFGFELTTGLRMSDLRTQLGGRSALATASVGYGLGATRVWWGVTTGRAGPNDAVTPDPAPGFESGLSYSWRQIGVAVSAATGHDIRPTVAPKVRSAPIIRIIKDSLGLRADTIYPPQGGDSLSASGNRWSSTEARVTWREERWWLTARAGRLTATRQASGFWAGLQGGAALSHGVSLLLGVGTSSRALKYTGQQSAAPHVSIGFGFNTAVLSKREDVHADSSAVSSSTARPFTISNVGPGRYRVSVGLRDASVVEIACDCDGWRPVPMTRAGSAWFTELEARPGVHHVSIRVNGGGWIAPQGLVPVDDDFAGQAGLLVVP